MDTYNAIPMHAGKNTVIEAGTKPWRNAGHGEPVHSDWEIWRSFRSMHGPCSLSLGNKLTEGGPPGLPILVLYCTGWPQVLLSGPQMPLG